MRVRALGWTVSLGVLAAGLAIAAAGAVRNAESRRRAAETARQLRARSVASATHLRDQASEGAGQLRDQWTQAALEVRDRWSETAEDVRGRADEWRERSTENFERALRQAAEARDESLAGLPDEDEDRTDDADGRPVDPAG